MKAFEDAVLYTFLVLLILGVTAGIQITFIVLKILSVIAWPWTVVFSPALIVLSIAYLAATVSYLNNRMYLRNLNKKYLHQFDNRPKH